MSNSEPEEEFEESTHKKGTSSDSASSSANVQPISTIYPKRRFVPGTKREDIFQFPHISINNNEGPFALQEEIQVLSRREPDNLNKICKLPRMPNNNNSIDKWAWILEHIRQFLIEINVLLVKLEDVCNSETCPIMQATDKFKYRCAAHPKPKDCSAMDYCTHTIDSFIVQLNDPEHFPSRLSVDTESRKYLKDCARRLYRVFAHAYHHHPKQFRIFEEDRRLCSRFLHLIKLYSIVSEKILEQEVQIPDSALYFPQPKRSSKRPLHPSMQMNFKPEDLQSKSSDGINNNLKPLLEEENEVNDL